MDAQFQQVLRIPQEGMRQTYQKNEIEVRKLTTRSTFTTNTRASLSGSFYPNTR